MLKGFEIETIDKVKSIYQQVSIQLELCDLNILVVQRNKLKTLLEIEKLTERAGASKRIKLESKYQCYRETHEKLMIEKLQLHFALKRSQELLVSLRESVNQTQTQ